MCVSHRDQLPAKDDRSACQDPHKERQVSEEVGHLRAHLSIETKVIDEVEARCTPQEIQLQTQQKWEQIKHAI